MTCKGDNISFQHASFFGGEGPKTSSKFKKKVHVGFRFDLVGLPKRSSNGPMTHVG
jgi:hypothetical protein